MSGFITARTKKNPTKTTKRFQPEEAPSPGLEIPVRLKAVVRTACFWHKAGSWMSLHLLKASVRRREGTLWEREGGLQS